MPDMKPQLLPVANRLKPFWLSEADPTLENAHTTEKLPSNVDVVIIGSGLSGAITAYHLTGKNGTEPISTLMLEAAETCSGATARNGARVFRIVQNCQIPSAKR